MSIREERAGCGAQLFHRRPSKLEPHGGCLVAHAESMAHVGYDRAAVLGRARPNWTGGRPRTSTRFLKGPSPPSYPIFLLTTSPRADELAFRVVVERCRRGP